MRCPHGLLATPPGSTDSTSEKSQLASRNCFSYDDEKRPSSHLEISLLT